MSLTKFIAKLEDLEKKASRENWAADFSVGMLGKEFSEVIYGNYRGTIILTDDAKLIVFQRNSAKAIIEMLSSAQAYLMMMDEKYPADRRPQEALDELNSLAEEAMKE